MKKIVYYIAALAAVVACNTIEPETEPEQIVEDPVPEVKMITETVSGTRGTGTKVTIANSNGAFAWTSGDNIAVHISNGKYVSTSDTEHGASGASVAAGTASFTVAYEEGYARDAFAVYPSNIVSADAENYGQTGCSLDITLPSLYKLSELTGETTPCPMIATNAPGSKWAFKQLCGFLRLTVNIIPPSTKRLEIDFDGKKVCGAFAIASPVTPGTSVLSTSADDAHDVITVVKDETDATFGGGAWLDGLVLNIPLPVGNYSNITITAYDATTGGNAILSTEKGFAYTASCGRATKRTCSFHVFSISGSKRVIFAPGNLQATYDKTNNVWTWGFADNQYDYVGNNAGNTKINGNGTLSQDGTVDLFGTSTSINYYGITTSSDTGGSFVDWGTIGSFKHKSVTTAYASDYWFTLTVGEWKYVIGEDWPRRQNGGTVAGVSDAHCTKATVNGIKGLILFPDYYTGGTPDGVTWDANSIGHDAMGNSGTDGWGATVTSAGWAALEKEGCVFLPAAGYMSSGSTTVNEAGSCGAYKNRSNYEFVRFDYDGFDSNHNGGTLAYRRSVRLVHEIK